jgi:hypothetical protein
MADQSNVPYAGGYDQNTDFDSALTTQPNRLTFMTNVAGALVSLMLVAGIAVWGYKLLMRDVSGIPVVRAAAGEMRVRPEEPGGQLALNQGLSVNAVAAEGTAAAPADQLRLAPQDVDLTAEDTAIETTMVATAPQPTTVEPVAETTVSAANTTPDVAAALQSGNVDDLVAQLTQGVAPLSDTTEAPQQVVATVTDAVVAEVQQAAVTARAEVIDAPGVRQSLRPRKRPAARAQVVQASLATATPTSASAPETDAASLPAGTRLAQLGAFDSEEVAREQWDQISTRFSVYLEGKTRIIQKATSGGRVFYRLRAMGFDDIADARRFCSALVAENADCIPVVTR